MAQKRNRLFSVIIPAYRQEGTILRDVRRIERVLSRIRYDYEIVVVIDGQVDKTYQKLRKIRSSKLRIYQSPYRKNQGKGYAIRLGMKHCRGDYVAFIDAGMEIDPNGLSMLLEHMEWYRADVIVGSKRHPASVVDYPLARRILSRGYYVLVKVLFGINVKDTQAGIKIFRREVLEQILPVLLVKRYAFDVEILSVANRFGFKRIYEAPIKLEHQFENLSSAASLKTIWSMLVDTAAVFYRLNILHYYEKKGKRKKE